MRRGPKPLSEEALAACCTCGLSIDADGHRLRCPVGQWRRREGLSLAKRQAAAAELARLLRAARQAILAGRRPC